MPTTAIWRANERLVVQTGDRFYVIDATGQIVERLVPTVTPGGGIVEYLEYAVHDRSLVETYILATLSGPDETERVVIAGLDRIDDADTTHFVKTVLDDDLVADEERRLREP